MVGLVCRNALHYQNKAQGMPMPWLKSAQESDVSRAGPEISRTWGETNI
jgi:hypothetical protein